MKDLTKSNKWILISLVLLSLSLIMLFLHENKMNGNFSKQNIKNQTNPKTVPFTGCKTVILKYDSIKKKENISILVQNLTEIKVKNEMVIDFVEPSDRNVRFIDDQGLFASPLFTVDNILDFKELLVNVKAHKRPCEKQIWGSLSQDCRDRIKNWDPDKPVDESLKKSVVSGFNEILNQEDFYNEKVFSDLKLTKRAKEILKIKLSIKKKIEDIKNKNLQELNRLLLESIYPQQIKKVKFSFTQFDMDSILDYKSMLLSLKAHQHPYEKQIWDSLDYQCKSKINEWTSENTVDESLKKSVVAEFNEILNKEDFYDENTFSALKFNWKIKRLIERKQYISKMSDSLGDEEINELNRLLLESIYPHLISKTRQLIYLRFLEKSDPVANKPGNYDVFLCRTEFNRNNDKRALIYRWNNWREGRGCYNQRPPEFYLAGNPNNLMLVNLYFSNFYPMFYLLDIRYSGGGPNDFLGNEYNKKLTNLPVNPQLSPDERYLCFQVDNNGIWELHIMRTGRYLDERQIINWERFISDIKKNLSDEIAEILRKKLGKNLDDKAKKILITEMNSYLKKNNEKSFPFPSKQCIFLNSDIIHRQLLRPLPKEASNVTNINIKNPTVNRLYLESIFPETIEKSCTVFHLPDNHKLYLPQKGLGIRIPHKCWSPDGGKILFVGAMEKDWCANVYTVDIKTKEVEKVLDVNDTSRKFNPDLEWTDRGMVITCLDAIYVRDVKAWKSKKAGKSEQKSKMKKNKGDNNKLLTEKSKEQVKIESEKENLNETKLVKLNIPADISDMRNGRISPDARRLMFFGIRDKKVYLFVYDLLTGNLLQSKLGEDLNMENYQGAWIYKGKRSIIKNEYEYQRFRGLEDLRK